MLRPLVLPAALALSLAGCAAPAWRDGSLARALETAPRVWEGGAVPAALDPARLRPEGTTAWRNAEIADAFLRLAFESEDGSVSPSAGRLAEPVAILPDPAFGGALDGFLAAYAAWIGDHAGVDLRLARASPRDRRETRAGSRIVVLPLAASWRRRHAPTYQCLLLPGRPGEADGAPVVRVFVAGDLSGDRLAACLVEELTQALGLGNDLPDLLASIFNDDAVHLMPTALDMLMLRLLYALPAEAAGRRSAAVAAVPGLLARLNPAGETAGARALRLTPRNAARAHGRQREAAARAAGGALPADFAPRGPAAGMLAAGRAYPCSFFHARARRARAAGGGDGVAADLARARAACLAVAPEDRLRRALIDADLALVAAAEGRVAAALDRLAGTAAVVAKHGRVEHADEIRAVERDLRRRLRHGTPSASSAAAG